MGSRVQEYRANAAACERYAARSTDPEVHAVYRGMIRCWLDLASRAEWLEARQQPVVAPTIAATGDSELQA